MACVDSVPLLLRSILPGLGAIGGAVLPRTPEAMAPLFAEKSPTSDSGAAREDWPEKLNEYRPDKPPVLKTETSCKSISPLPTKRETVEPGGLNSMIWACCGETTAIWKKTVGPAAAVQGVLIFSQNSMVPRPSGPIE